MAMCNLKRCWKCQTTKEKTEFYKNKAQNDGLSGVCKECDKASSLKWAKDNPEKINARNSVWAKNNPEKARQRARNWRAKNIEKVRAKGRKLRAQNPEAHAARIKKWQIKNKSVLVFHMAKRRATRKNACPSWLSAIEIAQIKEFYDVALAKTVQTGVKHNVDHIVPLQGKNISGLHVPWNLQVITAKENFQKGNKYLEPTS
jgi:hypothetical protein